MFFETSTKTAGTSIHAVDISGINGENERFVTVGESFKVIKKNNKGKWQGHLIVWKKQGLDSEKSKYALYTPEGKELRSLGENANDFKRQYGVVYMTSSFDTFVGEFQAEGFGVKKYPSAKSVFEEGGNIFLAAGGKATQITNIGMDGRPTLSPDGKWAAFSREIKGKEKECEESNDVLVCPSEQLWIIDLETRSERKLLGPRAYDPDAGVGIDDVLEKFYGITFSPDSQTIYFSTPTYATASAIHAVDIKSGKTRLVTAGGFVQVVRGPLPDKYKEYLANGLQEDDWRVSEERGGFSLREKALNDDVAGYLIMRHSGIKTINTPTLLEHGWEMDGKYYISHGRNVWLSLDSPDGKKRIPLEKDWN